MQMEVRKRNVTSFRFDEVYDANRHVGKIVTNLDAFPKLAEDYQRQTASGAAVTILAFILIIILVISEVIYYSQTFHTFQYEVDPDFTRGVSINVDVVVAMPCGQIGADVLDVTGQNTILFGQLQEDDVEWELTVEERVRWEMYQQVNQYVKEEYHAIHHLLWRASGTAYQPPQLKHGGRGASGRKANACRLHGTLNINKVAGNFHITAGRVFPHPAGHAHISAFLGPEDYNFSHRILKFSFSGDEQKSPPAIINPLDGDEKITSQNYYLYQYIIKVVPTDINSRWSLTTTRTHQYSVTEQERSINHSEGSHGVPGIYFKYDFSPFKVVVSERHEPHWQFVVRLCGIVGGVFTTLGIVSSFISWVYDLIYGGGKQQQSQQQQQPLIPPAIPGKISSSTPTAAPFIQVAQPQPPTQYAQQAQSPAVSIQQAAAAAHEVDSPTHQQQQVIDLQYTPNLRQEPLNIVTPPHDNQLSNAQPGI